MHDNDLDFLKCANELMSERKKFNETLANDHLQYLHVFMKNHLKFPLYFVDDLVQDVFELAMQPKNYEKLKDHKNIRGWLILTAKKVGSNKMKKMKKIREHEFLSLEEALVSEVPEYNSDSNERFDTILESLEKEKDKELILDYYKEDMSIKKIAAKLNISQEAAKMRLSRIITKLRNIFNISLLFAVFFTYIK